MALSFFKLSSAFSWRLADNFYYIHATENSVRDPLPNYWKAHPELKSVEGFAYVGVLIAILLGAIGVTSLKNIYLRAPLLFLTTCALTGLGLLVYWHSAGWLPLFWQTQILSVAEIEPVQGFSYRLPLHTTWMNDNSPPPGPVHSLPKMEQF